MMTIREWKAEMNELVKGFRFAAEAGDIEKLREMLAEAEKIAESAKILVEGI